jgi:hypothetical protein
MGMSCKVSFDELMALLDGEVPEERADALRRHIGGCPQCLRILESQRGLENAWRESFTYPEPERFREMEEKTAWRLGSLHSRSSRWSVIIPAAAAAVAVLLGVKLIFLDGPALPALLPSTEEETFELETLAPESAPGDAAEGQAAFADTASDGTVTLGEQSDLIRLSFDYAPPAQEPSESVGGAPVPATQGYGMNAETVYGSGEIQDDSQHSTSMMDTGTGQASEECAEGIDGLAAGGGGGGMSFGATGFSPGLGGTTEIPDEAVTRPESGSDFFMDGDVERNAEMLVLTLDQETPADESTLFESLLGRLDQEEEADVSAGDELSSPAEAGLLAGAEQALLPVSVCTSVTEEGGASASCVRSESLTLVFDPLGMPDSSTVLLLDSLFPDWSLYIPFAFRDTVLIATPGEVRLRLTGEPHPAEAE